MYASQEITNCHMIIIDTAFLSTNQNQRLICEKRFEFIQKMNKQVYLYTDIRL